MKKVEFDLSKKFMDYMCDNDGKMGIYCRRKQFEKRKV